MGAFPSKPPPIIKEDPSPDQAPIDGIGVGGTTQGCEVCKDQRRKIGCEACKFYIAQGVSASSAKLYRENGNVTQEQCNALSVDLERVRKNELAFDQVRRNLIDGKYYRNLNNGFCGQLFPKAGEEGNIVDAGSMNGRLIQPSIMKMTIGGGYSAVTKIFIRPSVPFNITLNNITETVETMTLFHPAPLRIENVQYDAVLTLNDTADSTKKLVALIPLKGSLKPGEGGNFLSKLATYMPGILKPNPASGQFDPIDVPTGNDWDLSRIFPGKPDPTTKRTAATDGFFTWKAVPPVERYLKRKQEFGNIPFPDIYEYGWKPVGGIQGPTYIMLHSPIEIGVFDLQTIRMLPVTPTEDAMPPPLLQTVTYTAPTECKSNAVLTGNTERFENKASCDPFAGLPPVSMITPDTIFSVVLGLLSAIAIFIGLYFALKYASDSNWGSKIQDWGRQAGKYFAKAKLPAPVGRTPESAPPVSRADDAELARVKAEADIAEASDAELKRLEKQATEAEQRLSRPRESGQIKATDTREGEDFAFSNPLADRQRKSRAEAAELARLKKEAAETAELARLKKEADEAVELERLRRQAETDRLRAEASGTGLLSRDELQANDERRTRDAERAELARLEAEVTERNKADAEAELMRSLKNDEPLPITRRTPSEDAKHKEMMKRTKELADGFKGPKSSAASVPVKRRVIAIEPPDSPTEGLKRLEKLIAANAERKQAHKMTLRKIVDARNKAKTLRASPPSVPSQADREIKRLQRETDAVTAEATKIIEDTGDQARRQREFYELVKGQVNKLGYTPGTPVLAAANKSITSTETDAEKTKTQVADEREKVERDLKAAQTRLRLSQPALARATVGRNHLSGRGKTRRTRG